MNTLTRIELASKLAKARGITVLQAHEAINQMLGIIQEALIAKRKVELRGFGTFMVKTRAPRLGRDPRAAQTASIQIPERTIVRFKIGSHLRQALNPVASVAT